MLVDLIRKVVPIKYRQSIGLWTARQASRSKVLLYPYMYLLCGRIPKNLQLLPGSDCRIHHEGFSILCPRDSIFTSWEVLQDRIYEKVFVPQKGDTVVDIGAHVGMFSIRAFLAVGTTGKVIAIEPSRDNIECLHRNTELIPNITIIPTAVGSTVGSGELSASNASPCHSLIPDGNKPTETVYVNTLDNILARHRIGKVDFIKIDAEGYEYEILLGATKTLKNNKLKLVIASYHDLPAGGPELPYIVHLLRNLDYEMKIIKEYVYAEN